jgi:DNA-directed RNA polymerase specialized sigma24 family protein
MLSAGNEPQRLADRLRDPDETLWRLVEKDVMPRVLAALQRRFGPGRRWHDLEGFARSAQRAAWRLLTAGDYAPLEELETLAQLECWLVLVAARKFNDALRRAAREAAHAPDLPLLLRNPQLLDGLGEQSATAVVEELEARLEDETDRVVFRAKLEEKTEAEISLQLNCSTRKVRSVWQRVRQRLASYP